MRDIIEDGEVAADPYCNPFDEGIEFTDEEFRLCRVV
ncbi:hypothetical protein J2Z83_002735 [Virgibacillus natechei]|uniref:Uncharacterized protein n=1 Tax=Virgibacillus natechei TaxID=1216297 RepID=A0ABS4IKQ5_9BACI|nr:hypothetical protein [Virgibacillus natechei]